MLSNNLKLEKRKERRKFLNVRSLGEEKLKAVRV
ncbi:hypothetical protein V6Z11_A10G129400 [Gossypium hirsutum]